MSEPDLNLLVALDALLATGSVAGAARRLGLSASAMSRTLARLRAATEDPLLVRAGQHMVPTPGAERLRERIHELVHEARTVLRPSAAAPDIGALQRRFTIRANDGFVEAFAAPLIAAVTAEAPLVTLAFAPKPQKSSSPLREGAVDLEIGVASGMGPEVRLQTLFRDRFIGVVRQGHALQAVAAAMTAAQYAAAGHVVASRRGRGEGPVDEALAAMGLKRRIVAVVPGFAAAVAVARASDLVALVPASFFSAPSLDAVAGLCCFELPVAVEGITVSQMWHPRQDGDQELHWLRQTVLAVCRRQVPS